VSIRIIAHEKNWRKGRVCVSRDFPIFWVPPIISGTGKATDFKFSQYIQRVHPNKSPWQILDKRKRGHIQGLPKLCGYPLLSQEQEKLQISNLASTFRGSIRIKAHENFWRKVSVGISRDYPNFLGTPYYQEREKLQISNLASTFRGSIRTKAQ